MNIHTPNWRSSAGPAHLLLSEAEAGIGLLRRLAMLMLCARIKDTVQPLAVEKPCHLFYDKLYFVFNSVI